MGNEWHSISNYRVVPPGTITAEAVALNDSPWFNGHFPDNPVLPGVAELSMVYDLIRRYQEENDKDIKISSIRRIRFRKMIKPGEKLNISLEKSGKDSSWSFNITSGSETACTGIIFAE